VKTQVTVNTFVTDEAGLAAVVAPRADLVLEAPLPVDHTSAEPPEGHGPTTARFACEEGPFAAYERQVSHQPAPEGGLLVTERISWSLGIPLWGPLFQPLVARDLRRSEPPRLPDPDRPSRPPWWAPPDRLDLRATGVLSRLCVLSMLAGYLGTTITQTMTFAADEFDASKAAQGSALGAVRAGVLLSLVLMAAADRRGRKRLLTVCAVGGAVASAAGALSSSLWALGATQTFARAFSTALALLIGVVAAEEMPSGGRAFAASVLAMTGALGAGGAVILLPLAGLAPWAWRIIYLIPLMGLVFFLRVARDMPESRRFLRPHARTTMRGHRGRLLLLGASGFFGLIFLAPITQFQNDFLRDEHGFAAWQLTVFTFATSTPAGIGVIVGGRLADERGRRVVGATGTLGGAIFLALAYQASGPWLWLCWLIGSMVAAVTVPALGVYGPELFPTALRGRANGLITVGSVAGSTVGLFLAGRFADEWGSLGPGIALLAVGPVIVSVLVLTLYPETAHLELEDINPQDALDMRGRTVPPPIL
jgi:MFS family permease